MHLHTAMMSLLSLSFPPLSVSVVSKHVHSPYALTASSPLLLSLARFWYTSNTCPCIWIVNPHETGKVLQHVLNNFATETL